MTAKRLRLRFENYWNKFIDAENYVITKSIEDIKKLGIVPYFQINNVWVYTKDELIIKIRECVDLILSELGYNYFSRQTVWEAIRNEIKFHINDQKTSNEHLEHILEVVKSHNQKRLFIRVVSGLFFEGVIEIKLGSWRLTLFGDNDIQNILDKETGDEEWKHIIEKHLSDNFKGKLCLFVEAQGDEEKAKYKADKTAKYIINTLRYFICLHLTNNGFPHEAGIFMDQPEINRLFPFFSFNLEKGSSTIHRLGYNSRQEYVLTEENLKVIRTNWNAEKVWLFIERDDLTDLEASIVSAISWLGDAHQERDTNIAYIKYWVAIEALITGYEKGDRLNFRLKNAIPLMLSQIIKDIPTKTEVDSAYALRSKVIHSGYNDIVALKDLNKVCKWATGCIAVCMSLCNLNYESRQQVEDQLKEVYKKSQ